MVPNITLNPPYVVNSISLISMNASDSDCVKQISEYQNDMVDLINAQRKLSPI